MRDWVDTVIFWGAIVGLTGVLVYAVGCAGQVGPVAWAFGQSSVCRGPAESFYSSATGELEAERCEGGYVAGGALSGAATGALEAVGEPLMRVGAGLSGVPVPSREPVEKAPCSGDCQ